MRHRRHAATTPWRGSTAARIRARFLTPPRGPSGWALFPTFDFNLSRYAAGLPLGCRWVAAGLPGLPLGTAGYRWRSLPAPRSSPDCQRYSKHRGHPYTVEGTTRISLICHRLGLRSGLGSGFRGSPDESWSRGNGGRSARPLLSSTNSKFERLASPGMSGRPASDRCRMRGKGEQPFYCAMHPLIAESGTFLACRHRIHASVPAPSHGNQRNCLY
jgi:hypothetical protein